MKKGILFGLSAILAWAIIALIILAALGFFCPLGDVNADGTVNITDYTLIRLERMDLRQLTGPERRRADVNHDGLVDNGDITAIKMIILEAE